MLEQLAARWLGSTTAVNFVPVTEATAFDQLERGEVDLLVGGWVRTWEARQRFDFSHPLLDDGLGLLSLENAPVSGLAEVGGRPVGVIAGTVGEASLPEIVRASGVAVNISTYPTREEALAALQSGEIAALAAERYLLLDPLYRQTGYFLPHARLSNRPVGWVLPRGDSDFRDRVNLTLAQFRADGTFSSLYTTWFDDPVPEAIPWPGAPLMLLTLRP